MALKFSNENILEFFDYNSHSGALIIKHRRLKWFNSLNSYKAFNTRFENTCAKTTDKDGYIIMTVLGVRLIAHRVIWFIMTGDFPNGDIDHINHIRDDNRWKNLREVTRRENLRNISIRKNSPYKIFGISKIKETGRWRVKISTPQMKGTHLGVFNDFFEAVCCRKSAENKYGFHANHGSLANATT